MRLLLDRGVPKGGRRQILPPWKEIVPLGIELRRPNAILLPRHPGNGPHPQVLQPDRLAGGSSKPAKFPWFWHEFIHPHEIYTVYRGKPLPRLFGGVSME